MNFASVKALTIPEGEVKSISIGGTVVWEKQLLYDARVEYLESTGTQYVDTGVDLVNGDTFMLEVDGRYTSLLSRYQLMGVYASSYFGVNPNNRWIVAGGDGFDTANADTSRHAFTLRSTIGGTQTSYLTIDGASYSRSRTNNAGRMYLLNIPASGQTWTCAFAVYSARLTVNGVLVRDFIPVRVGTVGYLYDKVSNKLYGNAGTGDFICGGDL